MRAEDVGSLWAFHKSLKLVSSLALVRDSPRREGENDHTYRASRLEHHLERHQERLSNNQKVILMHVRALDLTDDCTSSAS